MWVCTKVAWRSIGNTQYCGLVSEFLVVDVFVSTQLPVGNALTFLGVFAKLRKATTSSAIIVSLSAWNKSTPTGRIFHEI